MTNDTEKVRNISLFYGCSFFLIFFLATYHWPDGDYFEGEFVEGARWGKGVLYCKTTNETYDQEWKEVKFDEHNKGIPSAESNSQWSVCVSVKRKSSFEDSDQKRKSPKYE